MAIGFFRALILLVVGVWDTCVGNSRASLAVSELVSPDAGTSADIAARSVSIVLGVGGSCSGFGLASSAINAGSSSTYFASPDSTPFAGSGNTSAVKGKGQASGVVAISRKVAGISPLV